jgi:hypothetical protein
MQTPVCYTWSKELARVCDELPANLGRSSLVHGLHFALGLDVRLVEPDLELGSSERLKRFHNPSYIGELRLVEYQKAVRLQPRLYDVA